MKTRVTLKSADHSSRVSTGNGTVTTTPKSHSDLKPLMENSSVRIWGIAADGKTFSQRAAFRSLSRTGAWIEGIDRTIIQPGEVIGLQYEANRARVRVGFVDTRQERNITLAVVLVDGQRCPWERLVDLTTAQLARENRRRYHRHRIELQVELRSSEGIPMRVSATDACGNGCYLQTMATVSVGTQFKAAFSVEDQRILCECTVRTSDSGLGMGIEFTGLDADSRLALQTWLDQHCTPSVDMSDARPILA